jgi:putative Holliday junction resolvase
VRVLALDIGERRIGVAAGDIEGGIATPLSTITRRTNEQAIAAIQRMVAEQRAEMVVIGLPISFDGQLHSQGRAVQQFAERLRGRLAVPIAYSDETLSTVRAEDALRAAGVRPERIRERIDAAAAAVILQEYLDRQPGAASGVAKVPGSPDGPAEDDIGRRDGIIAQGDPRDDVAEDAEQEEARRV